MTATVTDRPPLRIRRKRRIYWGDWLAPGLILATPFVNFLGYHDYGLLHPESLAALAVLAGIGLAASVCIFLWQGLRPVVLALALAYVADMQPDLRQPIARFARGVLPADMSAAVLDLALLAILCLVCLVAIRILKKNAGAVLTAAFAVMLVASFLLPGAAKFKRTIRDASFDPPAPTAGAALPAPLVHIVLDEFAGLEGLPENVPGGPELRSELKDFYLGNGFRLYGRAFSPYYNTENSLSNLLNGTLLGEDLPALTKLATGRYRFDRNAWFEALGERGYRIRVFQTDILNFCARDTGAIAHCTTYPANGIVGARDVEAGLSTKTALLFKNYFSASAVNLTLESVSFALENYQGDGEWKPEIDAVGWRPAALGPLWSKTIMERLIDEVRTAKPGDAFYAHLLLPHRGFVLDENCRTKRDLDTWFDHPYTGVNPGQRLSESSRTARYVAYFQQIRCTQRLLGEMMEALAQAGVLDEAIVILHGDHGSRITGTPPLEKYAAGMTRMDAVDSFSASFAIRAPGVQPGYDASVRSIQALFGEYALRRPLAEEPAVYFITPEEREPGTPLAGRPLPDLRWSGSAGARSQ